MDGSKATPSPQLIEANRRLHALRAEAQRGYPAADRENPAGAGCRLATDSPTQGAGRVAQVALPAHLGWGSAALTAVLRRQAGSEKLAAETAVSPFAIASIPQLAPKTESRQPQSNSWVKLYPDIGLGMLRQELTAPGRLWLLLRYLDPAGQGMLRIDIIQQTLTPKTSALRLCGKRQLRNLLRAGDGIFWTGDGERLWLRSAARVAAALDVARLSGKPVALPLNALLEGIGDFRAHLYAAFHSGRTKETPQGRQAMPLARATLTAVSGVGASSQRNYEARVGLRVQTNYAIGERLIEETGEEQAWRQGTAVFGLRDYHGQQGAPGRAYLAWQLPNSYVGQHPRRPKGRQKRINQALKDLVKQGTPGNVGEAAGARPVRRQKRYYALARQALRTASRQPQQAAYWRNGGQQPGRRSFVLWQQVGG